ncbi:FadR family transcriptional regulator [Roseomonas sp. NAR14]|uniref:FadR family transcriptional regulator n=1 Tax=Roseomonas acroporae TaxID=2937791 RepID=A0A9X2BY02_9PROT|nr:FadR/GntR family transcriptional regulator [Roseomonas acroporae]MCK8787841.1 FadR family transcriptional regulator [Roseomonas acroporae]
MASTEPSAGLIQRLLPYIHERRLAPGDRLPSERDLAERFGVGRGAVREAIAVLETLRMVERRPNSGIYLRPVESEGSVEALVLQAGIGVPLSPAEVREIVELRSLLEVQAIALACERREAAHLAQLDGILAESERLLAAGGTLTDLDAAFHLAVVEAVGNRVFLRLVNAFYLLSRQRRQRFFAESGQSAASHAQHVAMRDAIAAREADRAVALMRRHLKGVESHWMVLLGRDGQPDRSG